MKRLLPLVVLCLAASAFATPAVFHNALPLRTGNGSADPLQLLIGNYGGDAAKDLLTVVGGHSIEVLIDTAGGVTGEPVITPITDIAVEAATGDVDGDGKLDVVAVTYYQAPSIVIYRGNGDGTFTRGTVIALAETGPVAVGDFNRDGRADIAVATSDTHSSANTIRTFLANGTGGFSAGIVTPVTAAVSKLTVLDANDDGKGDLAYQDSWGGNVALSRGDGTFIRTFTESTNSWTETAAADFNRDGKIDVAFANEAGIAVFLGQNNGNFTKAGSYPGLDVFALTVADVDGDGKADLLGGQYSGSFGVWRGNGDGTFATPVLWHTGHMWDIAAGDFNRDGKTDVVFMGGLWSDQLRFIAGTGGGAFDAYRAYLPAGPIPYQYPGPSTSNAVAADLNGDGAPDLLSVVKRNAPFGDWDLSVMLNANDHAGTLQPPQFLSTGADWLSLPGIAAGDVNGDGKIDLVTTNATKTPVGWRTYLGNGDGTLQPPIANGISVSGYGTPVLADFNGDGALDVAMDSKLYFGANNGTFSSPHPLSFAPDAIGDFDEDGLPDVVYHPSRETILAMNNGDGTFAITQFPDGDYAGVGGVFDLDADGHLDMLLIEYSGTRVRLGRGDGTFGEPIDFSVSPEVAPLGDDGHGKAGDFDGDGKLDFALGPHVYLGNGDGRFRTLARVEIHGDGEFGPPPFDVADFDGNGTADLAIVLVDGGAPVSIIRSMTGPGPDLTTTVALHANSAAPMHAAGVSYTGTVTQGAMPLMGAILFARNGTPFGLGTLDVNHQATSYTALARGPNAITATYAGDEHYLPVTATIEQVAGQATTSVVAYFSPPGSVPCGSTVPLFASLSAPIASGIQAPAGGLTFTDNGSPMSVTPSANPKLVYLSGLAPGTHQIAASYAGDANYLASTTTATITITQTTNATISASSGVFASGGNNFASVRLYGDATYAWSITNGTIDAGQGTNAIRYTAGSSGSVTLNVTVGRTTAVCGASSSATASVIPRADGASMFYAVTPCRVYDSRATSPLAASATRDVAVGGNCGIPAGAEGVTLNVTVVSPASPGWLSLYASDRPWPGTSTLNYRTAKTRANSAMVLLSADGHVAVLNQGAAVHFIVDVVGYFQ